MSADAVGRERVDATRAKRRAELQRLKRRAARISRIVSSDGALVDNFVARVNHLKSCSCWMCGNQRRWNGPTMQERKYGWRE